MSSNGPSGVKPLSRWDSRCLVTDPDYWLAPTHLRRGAQFLPFSGTNAPFERGVHGRQGGRARSPSEYRYSAVSNAVPSLTDHSTNLRSPPSPQPCCGSGVSTSVAPSAIHLTSSPTARRSCCGSSCLIARYRAELESGTRSGSADCPFDRGHERERVQGRTQQPRSAFR